MNFSQVVESIYINSVLYDISDAKLTLVSISQDFHSSDIADQAMEPS